MLNPEIIRRRLQKVDEYLNVLDGLRRYSLDDFLADPERYGSAERFLQLTIEALLAVLFLIGVEIEIYSVYISDVLEVHHEKALNHYRS